MLYDVNLGTRDYFTYTDAMFNNSLFSFFLQKNGLNIYKGKSGKKNESTRDIICLDYEFGSRSYDNEHTRLEKLFNNTDGDSKERIKQALQKVEDRKDLYDENHEMKFESIFTRMVLMLHINANAETEQLKKKQFIMRCFFVQVPKLNLDKLFS